jgi:octaprenyl-diphosphate synthase
MDTNYMGMWGSSLTTSNFRKDYGITYLNTCGEQSNPLNKGEFYITGYNLINNVRVHYYKDVNNPYAFLLKQYVKAVEALSEGELEQMDKAIKMDTTENDYYKIIYGKTASLFIAVITSAGQTAGATKNELGQLEKYAYHLGIAFQIRDDIFDYAPMLDTGKASGTDIKEKKITLPLIKALALAPETESKALIEKLKSVEFVDDSLTSEIMNFVAVNDGIKASQTILEEHCQKAKESLNIFRDSIFKSHLIELAGFVGTRKS